MTVPTYKFITTFPSDVDIVFIGGGKALFVIMTTDSSVGFKSGKCMILMPIY